VNDNYRRSLSGLGLSVRPRSGLGLADSGLLSPKPSGFLPFNGLGTSLNLENAILPSLSQPHWKAVRQRFEVFHRNLALPPRQVQDGRTKIAGIVSYLNRVYYKIHSETKNSFPVGSRAKNTAIRPPRDADIYFLLPVEVYCRIKDHKGNKQSALLQEIKRYLAISYPNTEISGDGQVVVVNFDSYRVEVIPAFELATLGRYLICDTHNGGSYKKTAPLEELKMIEMADLANAGNLRPLIRMLKAWQAECSVPIKPFHLELIAIEFMAQSPWRLKDWFYFDWITRDFFEFLYHRANQRVFLPGTFEPIPLGDDWQSRAASAYHHAAQACSFEYHNLINEAGEKWQKIFGSEIPRFL
jgi:hypothetical protein